MKTIRQKAKEYTVKRCKSMSVVEEILSFNGQNEGKAYAEGMKEAFRMIEHEIDQCAINGYKFPILHIRDFIDKMLERKKITNYGTRRE